MYSKLIHTVDHVEGYLREGFDSLDAFLCHTWAVTVTGTDLTRLQLCSATALHLLGTPPSHLFESTEEALLNKCRIVS